MIALWSVCFWRGSSFSGATAPRFAWMVSCVVHAFDLSQWQNQIGQDTHLIGCTMAGGVLVDGLSWNCDEFVLRMQHFWSHRFARFHRMFSWCDIVHRSMSQHVGTWWRAGWTVHSRVRQNYRDAIDVLSVCRWSKTEVNWQSRNVKWDTLDVIQNLPINSWKDETLCGIDDIVVVRAINRMFHESWPNEWVSVWSLSLCCSISALPTFLTRIAKRKLSPRPIGHHWSRLNRSPWTVTTMNPDCAELDVIVVWFVALRLMFPNVNEWHDSRIDILDNNRTLWSNFATAGGILNLCGIVFLPRELETGKIGNASALPCMILVNILSFE
jgi:hypothetical protein